MVRFAKAIPSVFFALFIAMIEVKPDQAASNLSSWLPNAPHWIQSPLVDQYGIGVSIAGLLLSLGWWLYPRKERSGRDLVNKSGHRIFDASTGGKISVRDAQLPSQLPFTLARVETGGEINIDGVKFIISPSKDEPPIKGNT